MPVVVFGVFEVVAIVMVINAPHIPPDRTRVAIVM